MITEDIVMADGRRRRVEHGAKEFRVYAIREAMGPAKIVVGHEVLGCREIWCRPAIRPTAKSPFPIPRKDVPNRDGLVQR